MLITVERLTRIDEVSIGVFDVAFAPFCCKITNGLLSLGSAKRSSRFCLRGNLSANEEDLNTRAKSVQATRRIRSEILQRVETLRGMNSEPVFQIRGSHHGCLNPRECLWKSACR